MKKSKKMKLSLLLLMAASVCMLFTSCLNAIQLNERALVQAVGIDLEEDIIKLTFQVFSPTTGGGANIGASSENAKIIQSEGKTISEAFQNATLIQGKQLFIGHMRIIVIGKALAKKGVDKALSYFVSCADSRQNVSVAVAREKASDIMNAKINQGILPAETLEKILENTKENGTLVNVKLFEFIGSLESLQKTAVLPMIGVLQGDDEAAKQEPAPKDGCGSGEEAAPKSESIEKVSSIKISGIAVFYDKKMVCELDDEESRGLLWITDKLENTMLLTSTDKYDTAAIEIYNCSTKLTPNIEGDNISFTLKVACDATLGEVTLKEGVVAENGDITEVEKAGAVAIEKECLKAFDKAIIQNKADIFDFGNIVWNKNVVAWKTLKDDWTNTAQEIKLNVDCRVKINRIGLSSRGKR